MIGKWRAAGVMAVFLSGLGSAAHAAQPDMTATASDFLTMIQGTWTYSNACSDTYTFRADGSFSSTSGMERLDGNYRVSLHPGSEPTFKIERAVTKTNGKPDCNGNKTQRSSMGGARFPLFDQSQTKMLLCGDPDGNNCFGPLAKQR